MQSRMFAGRVLQELGSAITVYVSLSAGLKVKEEGREAEEE